MNISNVYKIMKKEIVFNFSNYWVYLSAFIFCFINLIIIYFSEIISGDYSQTDIRSLLLSIIHLQMYLISLLSFILSYDAILSEKESGMLDLILSYKITFFDILLGKLFGNSLIFIISFLIGFFPVTIYLLFLGVNLLILFKFILASIWLSFIFNFIALYISNISKDRTFVILLSIFVWLFFLFIYDILFTFFIIYLYGDLPNGVLEFFLFLNPTEIFRLVSILFLIPTDASDFFGINIGFLRLSYIILSMLLWFLFSFFSLLFVCFINKQDL